MFRGETSGRHRLALAAVALLLAVGAGSILVGRDRRAAETAAAPAAEEATGIAREPAALADVTAIAEPRAEFVPESEDDHSSKVDGEVLGEPSAVDAREGFTILGWIRDENGEALAGASRPSVWARSSSGESAPGSVAEDGSYVVEASVPGEATLEANIFGWSMQPKSVFLRALDRLLEGSLGDVGGHVSTSVTVGCRSMSQLDVIACHSSPRAPRRTSPARY